MTGFGCPMRIPSSKFARLVPRACFVFADELAQPGLQYRRRATVFGRLFRNGCDRAGIHGKTFHDLRRTGLTEYGNSGATETQLSKIGGHKIGSKVIDIYVQGDKGAAMSAAKLRWPKKGNRKPPK